MSSENINNSTANSDEISLKELVLKIQEWWKYLLSKWLIIIVFGVLGGILGFAYAYFTKPVYTATTTFVLEENNSNNGALSNLGGLASIAGIDINNGGGLFQGDNILELYKSRTMIEKALLSKTYINNKYQLLVDRFIEFNELKKKWHKTDWSKADFTDKTKFSILQDSIISEIVKDIKKNYLVVNKLDKKLSIIKVEVKAEDSFFAKLFNDQIVQTVNDFYVQTKTKRSVQNVSILQHKTDSVRNVMNGAIYAAANVADATPNLNPTRQVQRTAPIQRSQFNAETNKSVLGELVKNLEMSKMGLLKETPLIQVIDNPVYPLEIRKVGIIKGIIFGCGIFVFFTVLILMIKFMLAKLL